jgi:putative ABC transport system permease protein
VTGLGAALLMGHSVSFMRFVPRSPLKVTLAGINLWLVVATMGVTLLARLWPVIRQSRWSIIDYARAATRPPEGSLWLWLYVDVLVIVPAAYAYRQLQQQGTIVILGWKSSNDIFRDPLLFLVPVLSMLAASLLCAQLFPLVMRILDRLVSGHLGLVWCLTLRQLGRQGRQYMNSLLLITASLSVGVFMASMASSLDRWLVDRTYYQLGADVVFRPESEEPGQAGGGEAYGSPSTAPVNAAEWSIPWDKLLAIPAVKAGTSVGEYRAEVPVNDRMVMDAMFLAVDRATFPSVAAFRDDFSAASLGDLMNRLAIQPDGVLVSAKFLADTAREVGDPLKVRVSADGTSKVEVPLTIVGVYSYFPTVYEAENPALVGSLDHLIDVAGGVATYDIWLKADLNQMAPEEFSQALNRAMNYVVEYKDVRTLVTVEQEKKERIGVYGTLTIGFLASLTLSGIGLLIQYQKSLRERLFRFATLRAIGISRRQVVGEVQLEYVVVLLAGVLAGVGIGVQASRLFIPYFRVSTADGRLPLPPLLLQLDRQSIIAMVAAFAALQIVAQSGLVRRALQTRLFDVLRMGNQE